MLQSASQSPVPGIGDAASAAPGQGEGAKPPVDGVKVTTTAASTSSASTGNSASGYTAQLVSQQASDAPASDQQSADAGFSGAADAPADKLESSGTIKDATAAANGPSDPKAIQTATAAPGMTADNTQAANVQAAATTQAVTTSAAAASAVIQQVTVHVSKAAIDGIDHINVQLNPPELGHVEVRMEIGPSGHFSAVFSADRPQTADMLQRNAHELTRSLQDAGVRTDTGSLSFNLRGQNQQGTSGWAGGFAGNAGRGSTPSWSNVPDEVPAPAAIYANSGIGTNRVDIRV
ncbi:MAG: flagellar hook-length control protein FliK [Alphaproteobacteria bacterium]|nr:flagellar hook-length control protein FliK [Alphaproteobacteria bacterium]